jgi:sodium/proline symporter
VDDPQVIEIASGPYAVAAFLGYLLLIIGLGISSARFSSRGISEFFIGGRRMNRIVVALSAVVSGRSAWLLLGVTGAAYANGASAFWAVTGYITVEIFLFLYYARRLRTYSGTHDCITVPDFFASRFNDQSGLLRLILVAIILLFMGGYVSSQFVAGGKAFASSFGLQPGTGLVLTAVIVLAYTMLGGFMAVSLTDMVQAFFMVIALVVLPVIIIADAGGWSVITGQLIAIDPALADPWAITFGAALGSLGIGLGSPGNPHILARYMSIDDPAQLRVSAVVGTLWNVLMAWGALFIGLAGRAVIPDASMLPGSDTENLYPVLAQMYLHPVLFGIVVASIFAAIMSTADSQLLVAASGVVRDVYDKLFRKGEVIPQRTLVLYSRLIIVVLVAGALVLGYFSEELVYWLVLFAWAGLGASLGPASILALYWKRTTRPGVIAGLIAGTLTTVIWYFIPGLRAVMYELIPGFAAGFLATVIVSLMTPEPVDAAEQMAEMTR